MLGIVLVVVGAHVCLLGGGEGGYNIVCLAGRNSRSQAWDEDTAIACIIDSKLILRSACLSASACQSQFDVAFALVSIVCIDCGAALCARAGALRGGAAQLQVGAWEQAAQQARRTAHASLHGLNEGLSRLLKHC